MQWASRISTIGLEFALPPLIGVGVDRWLHCQPLGVIIGAILGFLVGMFHILKIAKEGPYQS